MEDASNRPGSNRVTHYLSAAQEGDPEALEALYQQVYAELRRLARCQLRRESGGTLHTTEVVHEAYLRLCDHIQMGFNDRAHFFALSARAMRHVLIDHFRNRKAQKRGGGIKPLALDEGLVPVDERGEVILAVSEALERLNTLNPRLGEVVEYKFFGGMTEGEIGAVLDVSSRTVRSDWRKAKAWLSRELGA